MTLHPDNRDIYRTIGLEPGYASARYNLTDIGKHVHASMEELEDRRDIMIDAHFTQLNEILEHD